MKIDHNIVCCNSLLKITRIVCDAYWWITRLTRRWTAQSNNFSDIYIPRENFESYEFEWSNKLKSPIKVQTECKAEIEMHHKKWKVRKSIHSVTVVGSAVSCWTPTPKAIIILKFKFQCDMAIFAFFPKSCSFVGFQKCRYSIRIRIPINVEGKLKIQNSMNLLYFCVEVNSPELC